MLVGLKWLWTDLGLRLTVTGLRIREKHFPLYYWVWFGGGLVVVLWWWV